MKFLLCALVLPLFIASACGPLKNSESEKTPETNVSETKINSLVLGGGCFWCTDAAYKLLPGVTHITCGYSGGTMANPSYEDVCTERTGHAEVIKIDYDPTQISLDRLLDYFWVVHNPTQVGGQGN